MTISISIGSMFDNTILIYNKNSQKVSNMKNVHILTKCIYEKLTANNILNGKRLNAFLPKTRTRQDIHSHHFYMTSYSGFYPVWSTKSK